MDSKIEKQPFTLALLGTLTEYNPQLKSEKKTSPYAKGGKAKDYPKGETLSIVSSLIKTSEDPKKSEAKRTHPLQSDEITVINGPKIDASDVGEKIALGLAAILQALGRGQRKINIIAHSRGAVEAILISHELEAIQQIITSGADLQELLKQLREQQAKRHKSKPTNNTPDFIESLKAQIHLIAKEEQDHWLNQLKTHCPHATINFLGIDPVPGDFFSITWYDERFFVLPEIIKQTELIYYANEHSDWGFTPICPEVASKEKQFFVRYSMPGHHGTGSSGNNTSQQGVIVSPEGYKTTHVQKLLLIKLLQFLSNQGVKFNDGSQIFHQHSALGRKYLGLSDRADSINVALLDYPTILRTLYAEIAKNQSAYDTYNHTHYPYMGRVKQRRTLHKKYIYGLFNNTFLTYLGYVNEEHALLTQSHFFKIFGLDTKKNSTEILNTAHEVLEENIKKIIDKQQSLLDSEITRKNMLETYGIVIQKVSQHYLTHDWDQQQREKEALYQAIKALLAKLNQLIKSDNATTQLFITKLLSLSYISLSNAMIIQCDDLEKELNSLKESTDSRLIRFFSDLLMQLNHSEQSGLMLKELTQLEEYKTLPAHPTASKIHYLYNKLEGKGLERYNVEQLIKKYAEQFADTIGTFATLHQQAQIFIKDCNTLSNIIPSEQIELDESRLLTICSELVATAAHRFYKERPPLFSAPRNKDSFIALTEQYAIEKLGINAPPTNSFFSMALSFFTNPITQAFNKGPSQPAEARP